MKDKLQRVEERLNQLSPSELLQFEKLLEAIRAQRAGDTEALYKAVSNTAPREAQSFTEILNILTEK